jgi:YfiH family protein
MNLSIIKPRIFPEEKIISGVTERNQHLHPFGFSFCATEAIDKETAHKHRILLAKALGVKVSDFVFLKQIHSDIIHILNDSFNETEGDALITQQAGKILVVKIADCAGVLVYDPINNVVCAIHSGWRGSSKKIVQKTIQLMQRNYGTEPEKLLVYISPLASGEKYEVGKEVALLFPNSVKEKSGKYFFDNRKEIILQLLELGVYANNIEVSNLCTISNLNLHSFRRDKTNSGRMACFIGIKEKNREL